VLADVGWGAVLGRLPRRANGVLAIGACEEGWCPVRYIAKRRTVEGWAPAGNLAVAGGQAQAYDEDDTASIEYQRHPNLGGSTSEMFAAMEEARTQDEGQSRRQGHRGFWWGVLHPREAFGR
jgi:hypothetical protein